MNLESYIRDVPDFPRKGIMFKDITPLLRNGEAFTQAILELKNRFADEQIKTVVAVEARGYILGAPLAHAMNIGFVPIRKQGKLPYETFKVEYALEYGTDVIEIHRDALKRDERTLIIDDVLATGGTLEATAKLVEQTGAKVVGVGLLLELISLEGREKLKGYRLETLMQM
jgi:adenine phosphoribosyltransferase